jgi:endoglycosylceramidase
MRRRGLAALALLAAVALAVPAAAGAAARLPTLHAAPDPAGRGRIVDDAGREAILRGVNVNALAEYWMGTRFPTTFPLEAGDPARMRVFGWSAVRLLVSWSRIEPGPGRYDERYLARVRATAARLTRAGLYVFIDFHQDAWGPTLAAREGESCPAGSAPALGWDGAPGWATLVADGVSRCAPDGVRELSPAVRTAWQAFWADSAGPGEVGVQTRFLNTIAHTIERIGRLPGIAGYDVLNEPNAFGADENAALGALYGRAVPVIRGAEQRARVRRRLILFEPSAVWSETGSGPPPDFPHDRDVVYAPHIYTGAFDDGPITPAAFRTALAEARGFGGAPVLTGEWGAARSRLSYMRSHLDLQDRFGISGTQWTWRESCGDPHQRTAALEGTVATTTFAIWGVDCADNAVLGIGRRRTRTLMRGYVRAAPGRLSRAHWNTTARALTATGTRARRGVSLEAFYPGDGRVAAGGLRLVAATRIPGGGELVTAVARGGGWRLRVVPR